MKDKIEKLAYSFYLKRNKKENRTLDDWLRAERVILRNERKKEIYKYILKIIPISALICTVLTLWITWSNYELTHRPFLEIQPVFFKCHPQWQGEDESQVWCYLGFIIINHGKTPAYDVKVDKLDVVLDRRIDVVKDVENKVKHLCIFPETKIIKSITVTNSKIDSKMILDGEKSIKYVIKIRYRGIWQRSTWARIRQNYYWYSFTGSLNKNTINIEDVEGN